MADDNRLPTNQSQLDIKAELTAIKTAIQQLYAMQNKTDLTTIAPAENQIASAAHAVDDIFTYNGKLYQVTSAIDIGDDITNKITEIATTSYVNPTRMNHIEDGIEAVDGKTASDIPYSTGVSVKTKLDEAMTSIGTITGNTTKNIQFPYQSSGIFYFMGAENDLIGTAISHAWSNGKILKFIGTQPSKISFITGPDAYGVTNNSGNSLLVYYQKIRGDMPWMS